MRGEPDRGADPGASASIAERLRAWRALRRVRARERAELELRNRRIDDGTIWRSGKGGGHQR
jgi:hypothetical protein